MYEGYPHFFAWLSKKLEVPQKRFFDNLAEGVKFVLNDDV
jgi:hypothetical protein